MNLPVLILASMLGAPLLGWLLVVSRPRTLVALSGLVLAGGFLALETLRRSLGWHWIQEGLEAGSGLLAWAALFLALGFGTSLAPARLRKALVLLLVLMTLPMILLGTLGLLGSGMALGRTRIAASLPLSATSRAVCTRSGNALDDFRLTDVTVRRAIPFLPFERIVWARRFASIEVFTSQVGFRASPADSGAVFWIDPGPRFAPAACKDPGYRLAHRDCRRLPDLLLTLKVPPSP